MFRNKFEVDKHVENCFKKITNEKERNSRSYTFAKLYYNVGEYEQTRRFVTSYLSVKPKSAEAHYLLGLALEKLGKRDAALEAYRTSLQIDPKQNNLLLKVCELLGNDEANLDIASAKYFLELAENVDPSNPSIYNLKEKLIMSEQNDPESVIKLLLKELESRPTDITLRVRLLRNFVQNNKINEAYKHVHDIEEKNLLVFSNDLSWYEIVVDVLLRYKVQATPTQLNWSFWCLLISVLDKFLWLRLDERSEFIKECSEYINQLFLLDQSLYEASNNTDCPDKQLANEFLNHYRGQLYLHFATIIYKQAKKDLIPFKEAASITLPLLFSSYHIKPIDIHATWINHLQESQKKFVKRWHQEAAFRCSQAGHTLLSAATDRKSIIIGKAEKYSSGPWQEQIFKKVFVTQEQRVKMNTSYFVSNHIDVNLRLPFKEEVLEYDEESFYVLPDSLQHYVWVSLNNELENIKYLPFQGLQYSIKNLSNCGAETLNLLDVQAFLYACTLCAKAHLKNLRHMLYFNLDSPDVLPEAVTSQLCSIEQTKFLKAAYKVYKNESGYNSGEMRLTLIRGIETVRCVGRHGLDVNLLIQLGNIFAEKAEHSKKQSEIEFNDARAEIYWKAALPLLEKMKNNQAITYGTNRMFEYKTKDMPLTEILSQIDKGKLFLGVLAMKRKENEKALAIFEELKDPYASFHRAQIYKKMADLKINQSKESVTSEMRSQNIILLSKARDCFYLTLDRLREPSSDKNHPLSLQLGNEIEKIERLLSRIDPDSHRNECEALSDENVSSAGSTDHTEHYTSAHCTSQFSNVYSSPYVSRNETRINQSTPLRLNVSKKEARPSPERLDAQIRQLIATKDTTLNQVLEQSRIMVESQRNMVDELRNFKDVVCSLSGQVENLKTMRTGLDEVKDIKRSVDELKRSVDDLQNFRNVSDMVYELKKEIQNMKKDSAKPVPPIHDDIYNLVDDYADYNLRNNLGFGSNPYQNYPSRMQPAPALYPPGHYPPMFLPPYYPGLNQLAQSAAALAYGAGQQLTPDLRLTNPMAQTNPMYSAAQSISQPAISTNLSLGGPSGLPPVASSQSVPQLKDTKVLAPTTLASVAPSTYNPTVTSKAPPVNVVITSSDPLPTMQSTVSQPVLSVTIPPQHIKGNIQKTQPHNYQIPLPATTVTSTPSVLCKPTPSISTEGILSNVAPPIYSAVSDTKMNSKKLGVQIESTLDSTFSVTNAVNLTKPTKEYPAPKGKCLFENYGNLYKYNKESKQFVDGGFGNLKIFKNEIDNTSTLYMKKDNGQVIAHHRIQYDVTLLPNKEGSFIWSGADVSTGKETMEKFRFLPKNKEDGQKFFCLYKDCLLGNNATKAVQPPKTIENIEKPTTNKLGGFVFTGSPIFKTKESETPPVVTEVIADEKKQSPFANFTFGSRNSSNTSSTWGEISKPNHSLLSNISTPPSKLEESSNIPKKESSNTPKRESRDNSMTEEFVPTAEFQPVIPLPDMVEVKTGEENSEVLFDCRAKLYRYDNEKKEWKERGLGIMKILKDEKLVRLLMRREQVHKVCCNHQLLKSMNFQYMPNNLKALTWCAQDFADEILKSETFSIRFKTEEQANDFLKCILKAQESLNENNSLGKDEPVKEKDVPIPAQGFGDKFKPAKNSWECKACYITNDAKAQKCVACDTARPSSGKQEQKDSKSVQPQPSTGWGDTFKPKAGSWECECCMVRNEANTLYCVSCESPKDHTVPKKESSLGIKGVNLESPFKFTFGIGVAANNANQSQPEPAKLETTKPEPTSTFKFGETPTKSIFGSSTFSFQPPKLETVTPPNLKSTPPQSVTANSFVFGSPDDHKFEFKPRSPRKSSGPGDESDGSYVEEECDNIYFKPVIPLPDKVEVKTGEEGEEVMYCHRAKLFRFTGGEWKERGIGDLKILKNKTTEKLRVLMRRDQVLKICLNHTLTSDIEYLPKDDKSWYFVAPDFSEGEVSYDQFCLRFKTPEIAKEFKVAVDKNVRETNEVAEEEEENSDVEFVSETKVTDEELKEAQKLKLPAKFFAYRKLPLCNCAQCAKDDAYFKGTILQEKLAANASRTPSTTAEKKSEDAVSAGFNIFAPPQLGVLKNLLSKPPLPPQTSSSESALATPTLATSSTVTSAGCWFGSKSSVPANIFGVSTADTVSKPISITGTTENNKVEIKSNIFANKSSTDEPISLFRGNSDTEKKFSIFGPSSEKSLFGGPPVFGSISSNTQSVFGKPASAAKINIFGSSGVSSTNSLFESKNVFDSSCMENKSMFGGAGAENPNKFNSASAENKTITFGNANAIGDMKKSIFATPPKLISEKEKTEQKENLNSSGIFNTPTTKSDVKIGDSSKMFGSSNPVNIFGTPKSASVTSVTPTVLFGRNTSITTTASSIFDGNTSTTASIFGTPKNDAKSISFGAASTGSLFGSNSATMFGSGASFQFGKGKDAAENKVEQPAVVKTLFGGNAAQLKTTNLKEDDEVVLKCTSNISFSSLAQQNEGMAFGKQKNNVSDPTQPFAHLGVGAPVFSSQKKQLATPDKSREEEGGEDGADEEYDPHYEPIIPMPDKIVVTTGEEEETAVFNQRCKLYRFDTDLKEWKERGVGQLKILHHQISQTYRFLLRREQVHKVVLNQLINTSLDIQPMSTSEKAWMWAGHNFVENEMKVEKLAVRFKYEEEAKKFYEVVQDCLKKIELISVISPNDQDYSERSTDSETQDVNDYDEPELEGRSLMFSQNCILQENSGEWTDVGSGLIEIYYDIMLYACRITFISEEGEELSSSIIGVNTNMQMEGNTCTWKTKELARDEEFWRELRAIFPSIDAASKFHENYLQGISFAQEWGVYDGMEANVKEDETELEELH